MFFLAGGFPEEEAAGFWVGVVMTVIPNGVQESDLVVLVFEDGGLKIKEVVVFKPGERIKLDGQVTFSFTNYWVEGELMGVVRAVNGTAVILKYGTAMHYRPGPRGGPEGMEANPESLPHGTAVFTGLFKRIARAS